MFLSISHFIIQFLKFVYSFDTRFNLVKHSIHQLFSLEKWLFSHLTTTLFVQFTVCVCVCGSNICHVLCALRLKNVEKQNLEEGSLYISRSHWKTPLKCLQPGAPWLHRHLDLHQPWEWQGKATKVRNRRIICLVHALHGACQYSTLLVFVSSTPPPPPPPPNRFQPFPLPEHNHMSASFHLHLYALFLSTSLHT